jgi:YNFM family putative membrane transporter
MASGTEPHTRLRAGSAELRRANGALFAGGFTTFALLYCVQPLLPILAREFGVDAATSSLALSLSTMTMAVAMLVISSLADGWGRKAVMGASLAAATVMSGLAVCAPTFGLLLGARALVGLALAGLPAVAMAYLAEEVEPEALGLAMGLYIGGNAFGGMAGRVIGGVLADFFPWRLALGAVVVLAAAATVLFWLALPRSRFFQPRRLNGPALLASVGHHLRDPGLRGLYAMGFVFMGCFVTFYNYIGFHLGGPAYGLRQSVLAALFAVYLVGVFTSPWAGQLAGRWGRRRVLWIMPVLTVLGAALTLFAPLGVIFVGIILLTGAFFGGHSVASSWVGRRASEARAQASALYLFFYYLGGSVVGWAGGHAWTRAGWPGVAAVVIVLASVGFAVAWRLRRLPRLQPESRPETEPAVPEN